FFFVKQKTAYGSFTCLEFRRVLFRSRRAMKSAAGATMRAGAKGIRIEIAGRLHGAEMSRREKTVEGSVPLHTLRADIDYAHAREIGRASCRERASIWRRTYSATRQST